MKLKKVVLTFTVGILLQAGIYYYLDTVLFAATSDYQIGSTNQQEAMGFGVVPDGQAYYSFDKRFMATVVGDTVTIYQAGKKGEPQRVSLHGRKLSFFEWLPDRNLAIFASYGRDDRTDQFILRNIIRWRLNGNSTRKLKMPRTTVRLSMWHIR